MKHDDPTDPVVQPERSALLRHHAELIRSSGITDAVREASGYYSATDASDLRTLGFARAQVIVPSLVIPIHGVAGGIVGYQSRPDQPRLGKGGKPVKYETPAGSRMHFHVPPGIRADIDKPLVPLFVTEGVRKADAAASRGLCAVGLLGAWNWRGANEHGGKVAIPEWESVALNDRTVYLVFDSDVATNFLVRAAVERLAEFLRSRGASVVIVQLPGGDNGSKIGLDDFFAAGGTVADLLALPELAASARDINHFRELIVEVVAIAREGDPGAPFEPEALIAWRELQRADAATFARQRALLKGKTDLRTLDRLIRDQHVKQVVRESASITTSAEAAPLGTVEPGYVVLNDIESFARRFVVYPNEAARIAHALWIAHTHAVSALSITPRLAVISPEKGSGKSRLLDVTSLLVARPVTSLQISSAALYRLVEASEPTLLIDEVDAVFSGKAKRESGAEELRALINAGFQRGASVPRCVGEGARIEVKLFPVFTPVALAAIGELPDTVMSRSAPVVRMKRRRPEDVVEPFRLRRVEPESKVLRERVASWAASVLPELAEADPDMPQGVTDRAADAWESLLAIADAAGGWWPRRARDACIELLGAEATEDASRGVKLLSDIRDTFDQIRVDRLSSVDLVAHLVALEESPWGDLRGRSLDARELARRVRPYGVHPHTVRVGDSTPKGYDRADFADAWSRYAPRSVEVSNSRNSATPAASATENPLEANDVAEVAEVSNRGDAPQHIRNNGRSYPNIFDARCPTCGLHGRLRPAPGGYRCDACQTLSAAEVVL